MRFCFLSPGGFTGGPLALHQAAASLRELGVDASMLYVNAYESGQGEHAFAREGDQIVMRNPKRGKRWKFWKSRSGVRIDPRLKTFNVPEVQTADVNTHFVMPEVWPGLGAALMRHGCPNVHLWWLSVDNFPLSSLNQLVHQNLIRSCSNLCQSQYAADFARANGASRIAMLSDFIDLEEVQSPVPTAAREFDICYLPNKARGAEPVWEVLSRDFNVIALENMSREEIVATLSNCKIFLDCGFHPGKDRVPREAALCGCIPVVRREGAARFAQDVPLPVTLFVETEMFFEPERLRQHLHQVLAQPAQFDGALTQYRAIIANERNVFEAELKALANLSEPVAMPTDLAS